MIRRAVMIKRNVSKVFTGPHTYGLRVSILRGGGIYKRAVYFWICLCLERAQLAQRALCNPDGYKFPWYYFCTTVF